MSAKTVVRSFTTARTLDGNTRISITVEGQISDEEHAELKVDVGDVLDLYFPTPESGNTE